MEKENCEFKCWKCGGNKLAYQKYIKSLTPVSLQENGQIEYGLSVYDEDDFLTASNGFVCVECRLMLEHCGVSLETEQAVLDYLTMDPYVGQRQQAEYDEQLEVQIEAQDEQNTERECHHMG